MSLRIRKAILSLPQLYRKLYRNWQPAVRARALQCVPKLKNPLALSRTRIHPYDNVTPPHRILLILKSDGVFANHSPIAADRLGLGMSSLAASFLTEVPQHP